MEITAAVLNEAPGKLVLETLQLDDPMPDEVLIDVSYAGLCRTDLHEIDGIWSTVYPTVLGHEASGVVRAVGERVTAFEPGDHVVTCGTTYCGECRFCLSGRLALCVNRADLRQRPRPVLRNSSGQSVHPTAGLGAFAESMVVHQHSVVRIPRSISLADASVLGCAAITGLGAVFHSADVRPGSTVAVVGCGGVGISVIQGARIAGAVSIIAIDRDPARLVDASRFGATDLVDSTQTDAVQAVRDLSDGGVDYSFEAIGRAATVEQAFAMLGAAGTATVLGLVPDDDPVSVKASELFFFEKRLQGSHMGSNQFPTDIPRYVQFHEQGRLRLGDMLSTQVDLSGVQQGFELMRLGGLTRIVAAIHGDVG